MKKKALLLCAVILLVSTLFSLVAGCGETAEGPTRQLNFLVLGDSIGEAILGPSPLAARDLYAYCTLIGKVNGYRYHNRAVSGFKTGQLLEYVSRPADENAYTHITLIKEADIIDVSILGNDFLQDGVNRFAEDAMQGDFSRAERILGESYDNLCGIIDRIYELNPDVTLIMQTLYNPLFADTIMLSDVVKQKITEGGFDSYDIGGSLLNRLNDVLYRYLVQHPYKFFIADVNAKFDYAYRKGPQYLERYMYADCVHPSNEGHAAIFSVLQTVLEQLGLADHDRALQNYKDLCSERLTKLYSGTSVNVNDVKKAIKCASTYDKINEIYFDATVDVVPRY